MDNNPCKSIEIPESSKHPVQESWDIIWKQQKEFFDKEMVFLTALIEITKIENDYDGYDFCEIDEARKIAQDAITKIYGEQNG